MATIYGDKKGKDRIENMKSDLKRLASELVLDPEALKDFVKMWRGGFHNYSFNNYILASFQLGAMKSERITLMAGFNDWKNKHKRTVKKGEKALLVLAPKFIKRKSTVPEEEDQLICIGFRSVPVFDISQTEGEDVSDKIGCVNMINGEVPIDLDTLNSNYPYSLKLVQHDNGTAKGSTNGKEITVALSNNPASNFATYTHELAHCELNHVGCKKRSREVKELQAEAVSYLVCSAYGIDHEVAKYYISNWKGTPSELENHSKAIFSTAEKIIKQIDNSIGVN